MSATGRHLADLGAASPRRERDAYFTPDDVAVACVDSLDIEAPRVVVEPSVGGGAFARAVRRRWPAARIVGVDVGLGVAEECWRRREIDVAVLGDWADSLVVDRPRLGRTTEPIDLIVGNPPYRHAQAHVERALELAPVVAFLLRLAFLEGQARAAFWRQHPPTSVRVLSRRPSFTGGGTDSAAYGWFAWRRGETTSRLGWL